MTTRNVRLTIGLIMLGIAFIGLIIMNIHSHTFWVYTRIMAFVYAILSLTLYILLDRTTKKKFRTTIWLQLIQWLGLLGTLYVVNVFVNSGMMSGMQAGLTTLLLLALTLFLAGIYSDIMFIFIGVSLAIFAVVTASVESHLWLIMIPILLIAAGGIFVIINLEKQKTK